MHFDDPGLALEAEQEEVGAEQEEVEDPGGSFVLPNTLHCHMSVLGVGMQSRDQGKGNAH
jgi:hypothetical protein